MTTHDCKHLTWYCGILLRGVGVICGKLLDESYWIFGLPWRGGFLVDSRFGSGRLFSSALLPPSQVLPTHS